jgi:Rieske Fe-S protein
VTDSAATRRNVLAGLAAAGVATPILAACGGDDEPTATAATDTATTDAGSPTASPTGSPTGSPSAAGGGAAAGSTLSTADIPVGGGKIYKAEKLVITQPAAGEFKAFSAVCPHQGCILTRVKDGVIDCSGCHGSEFSIEDGSVTKGPATKGLTEKTLTESGGALAVS